MYVHIYIGTYIPSEGSEYPSEIFWEMFWYKNFCGKKIGIKPIPPIVDKAPPDLVSKNLSLFLPCCLVARHSSYSSFCNNKKRLSQKYLG